MSYRLPHCRAALIIAVTMLLVCASVRAQTAQPYFIDTTFDLRATIIEALREQFPNLARSQIELIADEVESRVSETTTFDQLEEVLRDVLADTSKAGPTAQTAAPRVKQRVQSNIEADEISIFAGGDIKSALTGSENPKTATGTLGVEFNFIGSNSLARKYTSQLVASVSVVSVEDTVTQDFGTSILAPARGGAGRAALVDFQIRDKPRGFTTHLYGSLASSEWKLKEESRRAIIFGVGGLLAYDIGGNYQGNNVRFRAEMGLASRVIMGDIAQKRNEAFRDSTIGTSALSFFGLEAGISITVGRVTAAASLYFIGDPTKSDVNGLTGGQFTTAIAIKGPALDLKKK